MGLPYTFAQGMLLYCGPYPEPTLHINVLIGLIIAETKNP